MTLKLSSWTAAFIDSDDIEAEEATAPVAPVPYWEDEVCIRTAAIYPFEMVRTSAPTFSISPSGRTLWGVQE